MMLGISWALPHFNLSTVVAKNTQNFVVLPDSKFLSVFEASKLIYPTLINGSERILLHCQDHSVNWCDD